METERLSRTRAQAVGLETLPGPPRWARQAACAGKATADRDPWHPDLDAPASARRSLVAEAVAVCAACPVQVQCGRYGIEMLADDAVIAVYGGMAPDDLRDMARRLGRTTRKTARHGTRSCYVKGCDRRKCRAANATYEAARRVGKRRPRRECPALASGGGPCGAPAEDDSISCAAHAIPEPGDRWATPDGPRPSPRETGWRGQSAAAW